MTRSMSQASRRNFHTPRRFCNVYSSAKVGSRVYRPNGLVKCLYNHQVNNINKYAFNRDSTIQNDVRRICTVYKSEEFGSLSAVQTTCLTVQTPTLSRSFCSCLHQSGRLGSQSGRLSVIDQLQILSNFNLREDCFNRPDDMDSHPDELINKARIGIQISPSGHLSALVRTRVRQLRKLPIRLQLSGRLPTMVRMRTQQKWKLRVEVQPSNRSSPMVRTREALYGSYLQRTCDHPDDYALLSGTRLLNMKDFQRKSRKFWSHNCPSRRPRFTIRTTSVHITAVAHYAPQPINRGPWALRTARIRY